jgi:hypothetical protein
MVNAVRYTAAENRCAFEDLPRMTVPTNRLSVTLVNVVNL